MLNYVKWEDSKCKCSTKTKITTRMCTYCIIVLYVLHALTLYVYAQSFKPPRVSAELIWKHTHVHTVKQRPSVSKMYSKEEEHREEYISLVIVRTQRGTEHCCAVLFRAAVLTCDNDGRSHAKATLCPVCLFEQPWEGPDHYQLSITGDILVHLLSRKHMHTDLFIICRTLAKIKGQIFFQEYCRCKISSHSYV